MPALSASRPRRYRRKIWVMTTFIALLRGINVGGHNRISMAGLRSCCNEIGWKNVQTYIQSGNLVFEAPGRAPAVEAALEKAVSMRFDLSVPVIVRTASEWGRYPAGNPFPEASANEPNLVMIALSKNPPITGTIEALRERAVTGESIEQCEDAIWIHFGGGVARSTLSPGLMDRVVGSPVTTRNWRTVIRLAELACV